MPPCGSALQRSRSLVGCVRVLGVGAVRVLRIRPVGAVRVLRVRSVGVARRRWPSVVSPSVPSPLGMSFPSESRTWACVATPVPGITVRMSSSVSRPVLRSSPILVPLRHDDPTMLVRFAPTRSTRSCTAPDSEETNPTQALERSCGPVLAPRLGNEPDPPGRLRDEALRASRRRLGRPGGTGELGDPLPRSSLPARCTRLTLAVNEPLDQSLGVVGLDERAFALVVPTVRTRSAC